ncbi:MAG: flagellar motor switch protein FliM [Planctomycetales bacterium]
MADILSPSEVESLLAALNPQTHARARPVDGARERGSRGIPAWGASPRQLAALRVIHSVCAGAVACELAGLLGSAVVARSVEIGQMPAEGFLASQASGSCVTTLAIDPLEEIGFLVWSPALAAVLIDRMLGGRGEPQDIPWERGFTEIERRLLGRATQIALLEWKNAWNRIVAVQPRVVQMDCHPGSGTSPAPEVGLIAVTMELRLGNGGGTLRMAFPWDGLSQWAERLLAVSAQLEPEPLEIQRRLNREAGSEVAASATAAVRLGSVRLRADELAGLVVGDILLTGRSPEEPLTLSIDGEPRFQATVGQAQGHRAARLGKPLETS